MKQAVKENGEQIDGLFRDDSGALLVKSGFDKYKKEKEFRTDFIKMKAELSEIKTMLKEILNGIR